MKLRKILALGCALALTAGCGAGETAAKDPVAITVWHYYNGAQQRIFDQLVDGHGKLQQSE